MEIRDLTPEDAGRLAAMFARLSDLDMTLIRENVHDRPTVDRMAAESSLRWIAVDGDRAVGWAAVHRLPGWSDHVGELRIVVDPGERGAGIGRSLTQQALRVGFGEGLTKVVIELSTDQEPVIEMFASLGFNGEALLRDHIRDREGRLHDLIVLAHHVQDGLGTLDAIGIADALA
ncbi:GNAT family N-acetyltransferase [Gordonia neofelifaecis]|uniref:GCN5-related N-acetyltransferase n=1 Tax=Gordonia neofelifaecis NRRL B-59395 TaxID=644548 RepID=F1YE85_9ACTN|nr:GNAT family N-acetyltransferase [Gordonia neofelifaecis]EGD56718.1 GCN5-related N-acetyltransferase [Gordonia neofelifaecis NRRL B-59395]